MNNLFNFLFVSLFVLTVSLAAFLPLSFLRLKGQASAPLVLGQSTGPNSLEVTSEDSPSGRVISVSGWAYPGQNTYYNNAFRLTNPTSETQFYKLVVLKTYPLISGLTVGLNLASGGQNVTLSPNSSAAINVKVISTEEGHSVPYKFTAKILTLNLNLN